MNVVAGQIRMLSEDLLRSHAVREHRDHRGDWKAQTADTGKPSHDVRVGGDALEGHLLIIRGRLGQDLRAGRRLRAAPELTAGPG